MRSLSRLVPVLLLAGLFLAPAAHAFTITGVGAKLGYTRPEGVDGGMIYGAHVEAGTPGARWHLMPGFLYESRGADANALHANLDLYYHFLGNGRSSPYLGAGVAALRASEGDDSSSDVGANLFGGIRIPGPGAHYFLEGRYTMADVNQVSILGGATFGFSH